MPSDSEPRTEALTPEEEAELRERLAALTEGEGITPGRWHAVEDGDKFAYGWWLDNEAGDSSFPTSEDVALFVNTVPRLLAMLDAARLERERITEAVKALPQMDMVIGPWPNAGTAPAVLLPAVLALLSAKEEGS